MDRLGKKEGDDTREVWIAGIYEKWKECQAPKTNGTGISVVPKGLLDKKSSLFYHPQVMSLGPYHFRKLVLREVEDLKSLILCTMHEKSGLESLLDMFEDNKNYENIEQSYSEGFTFSKEDVARMMVTDGSFVIEVLGRFSKEQNRRNTSDNGGTRASSLFVNSILDRKRCHPLLNDIVKDMLKMENQLPFCVLQQIKRYKASNEIEKYWYESALENLSPIAVARVSSEGELKGRSFHREYKEDHILQLLHDYIVDRRIKGKQGRCYMLIHLAGTISHLFIEILSMLILLLLFPFFIIWLLWHGILLSWRADYGPLEWPQSVSTVEELKRDGVKFKKLEAKGISHIKFVKSNSTLHLPKFRVDDKSEVILRNLIALEICSEEEEEPVIMYVNLMNHLINTRTDVAILRREDILDNKLGSDEDVAKLWNSFIFSTENPTYKPIHDTFNGIIDHRTNKLKVLWAQFLRAYCSKPWLFASALGAVLLLLLTIVQVVCLFVSCQRQNRP